jgi:Tol biopolymer transport system component
LGSRLFTGLAVVCCSTTLAGADASTGVKNGLIAFVHGSQIWTANPDGSGQRQLTFGGEGDYFNGWPSWSRDGRKIAFVSELTRGISTMNSDGSDVQALTDYRGVDASIWDPTWAPDGRIAFLIWSGVAAPGDVMVMNGDGSGLHALPPNNLTEHELTWSPDGQYFAFAGTIARKRASIYVMRADGTKIRRLTRPSGGSKRFPTYDTEPAWSPGSSKIVFTRIARPHGSFCFRILMIRRDGSGLRVVRNDCPLPDSEPTWSPDGRRILFSTIRLRSGGQLAWMDQMGRSTHTFRVPIRGIDADWQPVRP